MADIYTTDELDGFSDKLYSVGANPFKSQWKAAKALSTIQHYRSALQRIADDPFLDPEANAAHAREALGDQRTKE